MGCGKSKVDFKWKKLHKNRREPKLSELDKDRIKFFWERVHLKGHVHELSMKLTDRIFLDHPTLINDFKAMIVEKDKSSQSSGSGNVLLGNPSLNFIFNRLDGVTSKSNTRSKPGTDSSKESKKTNDNKSTASGASAVSGASERSIMSHLTQHTNISANQYKNMTVGSIMALSKVVQFDKQMKRKIEQKKKSKKNDNWSVHSNDTTTSKKNRTNNALSDFEEGGFGDSFLCLDTSKDSKDSKDSPLTSISKRSRINNVMGVSGECLGQSSVHSKDSKDSKDLRFTSKKSRTNNEVCNINEGGSIESFEVDNVSIIENPALSCRNYILLEQIQRDAHNATVKNGKCSMRTSLQMNSHSFEGHKSPTESNRNRRCFSNDVCSSHTKVTRTRSMFSNAVCSDHATGNSIHGMFSKNACLDSEDTESKEEQRLCLFGQGVCSDHTKTNTKLSLYSNDDCFSNTDDCFSSNNVYSSHSEENTNQIELCYDNNSTYANTNQNAVTGKRPVSVMTNETRRTELSKASNSMSQRGSAKTKESRLSIKEVDNIKKRFTEHNTMFQNTITALCAILHSDVNVDNYLKTMKDIHESFVGIKDKHYQDFLETFEDVFCEVHGYMYHEEYKKHFVPFLQKMYFRLVVFGDGKKRTLFKNPFKKKNREKRKENRKKRKDNRKAFKKRIRNKFKRKPKATATTS